MKMVSDKLIWFFWLFLNYGSKIRFLQHCSFFKDKLLIVHMHKHVWTWMISLVHNWTMYFIKIYFCTDTDLVIMYEIYCMNELF